MSEAKEALRELVAALGELQMQIPTPTMLRVRRVLEGEPCRAFPDGRRRGCGCWTSKCDYADELDGILTKPSATPLQILKDAVRKLR